MPKLRNFIFTIKPQIRQIISCRPVTLFFYIILILVYHVFRYFLIFIELSFISFREKPPNMIIFGGSWLPCNAISNFVNGYLH